MLSKARGCYCAAALAQLALQSIRHAATATGYTMHKAHASTLSLHKQSSLSTA
jgi:hypothetical protein